MNTFLKFLNSLRRLKKYIYIESIDCYLQDMIIDKNWIPGDTTAQIDYFIAWYSSKLRGILDFEKLAEYGLGISYTQIQISTPTKELKNNKIITQSPPRDPSDPSAAPRINFTEGVDSEVWMEDWRDKLMKAKGRDMCDNRRKDGSCTLSLNKQKNRNYTFI